jgi:phosphatidylserine/phosphatidylglycerophosphate/cardiolipin synthase-like enzyme
MQHYYHVIVNAQKEILFATMYWQKSTSANLIAKAFRDLSKRAGCENRHVIIKLLLDHPTISNVTHFHCIVPPSKWSFYDLPSPEEMPNISLEVHNYHRTIMGTFHVKFLIVDRKLALLNSNNIQDRPNLEMMSHFEGDIVNSFYDTFLISWWLPFQPNLVCLNDNAPMERDFHFGFNSSTYLDVPELFSFDDKRSSPVEEKKRNRTTLSSFVARAVGYKRASNSPNVLAKVTNHIASAVIDYDVSLRSQSPLTERLNKTAKTARSTIADRNIPVEKLEVLSLEYSPFVFHRPHEPVPIALVSRLPQGAPGLRQTTNPQDAAWMGAFRYAQKSIFIQSPTLNASPAIDGIIAACRRGIKVTLWLSLGFNDFQEGHGTFQGGTNEHVVKKLYKELTKTNNGTERNLEVFWYIGKGQLNYELLFCFS